MSPKSEKLWLQHQLLRLIYLASPCFDRLGTCQFVSNFYVWAFNFFSEQWVWYHDCPIDKHDDHYANDKDQTDPSLIQMIKAHSKGQSNPFPMLAMMSMSVLMISMMMMLNVDDKDDHDRNYKS